MKPLKQPPDCILFTAFLVSDTALYQDVVNRITSILGAPIETIPLQLFAHSNYYEPEMGSHLMKGFLGFKPPFHPGQLARVKRQMRQLEWHYGTQSKDGFKRIVNIDPGYVNLSHTVLATSKNFSHRIYLSDGIYAEVTLLYHATGWEQLPWTYPDYKIPVVQNFLSKCRKHLKQYIDTH